MEKIWNEMEDKLMSLARRFPEEYSKRSYWLLGNQVYWIVVDYCQNNINGFTYTGSIKYMGLTILECKTLESDQIMLLTDLTYL
jgi:hypothetical protein